MASFLLKRLVALVPVMLIVGLVVFIVMHIAPGDPAAAILGQEATQEAIDRLRAEMGLNKPLLQQILEWFSRVLRGDMGNSIFLNRTVNQVIYEHLQATLLLTGLSLVLSVSVGIVAGVIAAVRHNKFLDQAVMFLTSLGVAVPNFWLGLMLILVFALTLGWFPVTGYSPLSKGAPMTLRYLVLPALALALGQASVIARMTRANMLEVLQNDYIRTARAKGLAERVVIFKHALKNALIPTVTVIGLTFANLMGGAVVTEQIFNIPGIGRLLITSIAQRDYPVIEGIVLYIAAAYVFINLLVDLIYMYIDPRIKI